MSRDFSSERNYTFAGNSPIYLIDVGGNFKWLGNEKEQKEWEQKYPHFTKYMKENMYNDIMNSARIINALYKNTSAALTRERIGKDIKYGDGPIINPTLYYGNGRLDYNQINPEKSQILLNPEKSHILLNPEMLDFFEYLMESDAPIGLKQISLLSIVGITLHEYTHYGDALDGIRSIKLGDGNVVNGTEYYSDGIHNSGDNGYWFEKDVYGDYVDGVYDKSTEGAPYNRRIIMRRKYGQDNYNPSNPTSPTSREKNADVIDNSVLPTVPDK